MNYLGWGFIYLLLALIVFGGGYLFAAREFGKSVRFYKQCVRTLRLQMQAKFLDVDKFGETFQVAQQGLILWLEEKIARGEDSIAHTAPATLDNAFKRGEKFGLLRVLLHLQGRL